MKFTYNPEGFNEAKDWAEQQIYNKENNLTLWDFVCGIHSNSSEQLYFINKVYENKKQN